MQCIATLTATKQRCVRYAIRGTSVCGRHGGSAPQVRRRAAERVVEMRLEALVRKLVPPP